jgi:hypothetical protein
MTLINLGIRKLQQAKIRKSFAEKIIIMQYQICNYLYSGLGCPRSAGKMKSEYYLRALLPVLFFADDFFRTLPEASL